jgi:23S rRNA (uridine2552-2'-O)-methyltransferase
MSKRWLGDRKKEYYYQKAKSEEYRSRASYKLKQLHKKFKLIKRGGRVLDLGAAPGGWMQVAGEIVGKNGLVLGVDLEEINSFEKGHMHSIRGDITKKGAVDQIKGICESFDVVISDASPDISGVWDVDHYNSIELARRGLEISREVLVEGGNFLVKVFQGSLLKEFVEEVKREFEFSKISKPKASRQRSSEVYIIGKGLLKTPVKRGDVVEVDVTEEVSGGEAVAYVEGFKVLIKGGQAGEKTRVKIKNVSKRSATAVKI